MTQKKKTIRLECRTWTNLKDRKIRKPDGNWETFSETIKRLLDEKQ